MTLGVIDTVFYGAMLVVFVAVVAAAIEYLWGQIKQQQRDGKRAATAVN